MNRTQRMVRFIPVQHRVDVGVAPGQQNPVQTRDGSGHVFKAGDQAKMDWDSSSGLNCLAVVPS
jgi:hypothetical protein